MMSLPFSGPIACEPLLMLMCCSSQAGAPKEMPAPCWTGWERIPGGPAGTNSDSAARRDRRLADADPAVVGRDEAVDEHPQAGRFQGREHHRCEPGVLEDPAAEGDGVQAVAGGRHDGGAGHAPAEAGVEA